MNIKHTHTHTHTHTHRKTWKEMEAKRREWSREKGGQVEGGRERGKERSWTSMEAMSGWCWAGQLGAVLMKTWQACSGKLQYFVTSLEKREFSYLVLTSAHLPASWVLGHWFPVLLTGEMMTIINIGLILLISMRPLSLIPMLGSHACISHWGFYCKVLFDFRCKFSSALSICWGPQSGRERGCYHSD